MTFKARLRIALLALAAGAGAARADATLDGFELPAVATRDGGFNRAMTRAGTGASAVAIANSVSVTQSGKGNTLFVMVDQSNTGAVTSGVTLNGTLSLD